MFGFNLVGPRRFLNGHIISLFMAAVIVSTGCLSAAAAKKSPRSSWNAAKMAIATRTNDRRAPLSFVLTPSRFAVQIPKHESLRQRSSR